MPKSPTTPTHQRRSSGLGSPLTSVVSNNGFLQRRSHSRKSSIQSVRSVNSPRSPSAQDGIYELGFGSDIGQQTGNGLGSLADELAEEEWDEDTEVDETYGDAYDNDIIYDHRPGASTNNHAQSLSQTPTRHGAPYESMQDRALGNRAKMNDHIHSHYAGDENFEDLESIAPSLDARFADVEHLARQGVTINDCGSREAISRVSEQLKNLSSQVNVETHVTRLSNAFIALTTHLNQQSRVLSSLAHPIISPLSPFPDPVAAHELASLLQTLLLSLPHPASSPLPSIHSLHANTDDLLSTLSMLADSLQESRSTSNIATRQLRSAREMTVALRREIDEAEEGRVWLESSDCEAKLRRRDAAAACKEVVSGFEAVCEGWRERLKDNERNGIEVMAG